MFARIVPGTNISPRVVQFKNRRTRDTMQPRACAGFVKNVDIDPLIRSGPLYVLICLIICLTTYHDHCDTVCTASGATRTFC